jgi:hypothetical protein
VPVVRRGSTWAGRSRSAVAVKPDAYVVRVAGQAAKGDAEMKDTGRSVTPPRPAEKRPSVSVWHGRERVETSMAGADNWQDDAGRAPCRGYPCLSDAENAYTEAVLKETEALQATLLPAQGPHQAGHLGSDQTGPGLRHALS